MAPVITLYILGGCVAAAAVLFIVMLILSALRPPELPDISPAPAFQRVMRALTPLPFANAGPAGAFDAEAKTTLFRPRPPSPVAAPVSAPQRTAAVWPVPPPPPPANAYAPTVKLQQPQQAPTVRLQPQPPPPPQPAVPQYAARAYVVAPPAPPVAAPSPFAPSPFVWEAPPVQKPYVQVSPQPLQPNVVQRAQRAISFPTFPSRRRPRIWLRVFLGVFIVGLLASGAVVAYPAMLDPHCDKYEWFGADAAKVVREHARDAHAAIADFIDSL